MKPIIFLDIDGVLNNSTTIELEGGTEDERGFAPHAIKALKIILRISRANIVISSSWRHFHTLNELRRIFAKVKITRIVGKTKAMDTREKEIMAFVKEHGIKRWVAIDDLSLSLSNFVKTDPDIGLTKNQIRDVLAFL